MDSKPFDYAYDGNKPVSIVKWKTKVGSQLLCNSVILSYKSEGVQNNDTKDPLLKYKSNVGGTVVELFAKEGETVNPGALLLKIQPCTHPVIMKDLCAECGTDLRHLDRDNFEKLTAATTFSMVHVVPELKVCLEQAEKLGMDDETRLLKNRKLVLLVDLDQTLIHTTNDDVLKDLPDVHHFQLYGQNSPWYHTKLRPGTLSFLENISKSYELHICTFGARLYAHKIAQILDPDGKYFSHRILSRDECFDANSKTGNLKALFPRGDDMVCIIDDREDVWNFAPNVVHVKPYCYFHNTGDINAPPFSKLNYNDVSNAGETSDPSTSSISKKSEVNTTNKEKSQNEEIESKQNGEVNEVSIQSNEESSKNDKKEELINDDKADVDSNIQNENDSSDNKPSQSTVNKSPVESLTAESPAISENTKKQSEEQKAVEISENDSSKSNVFPELLHADDYLLYLEEILQNIHKQYYDLYDKMKKKGKKSIPDLKILVPEIRSKVLKGCNIVFSSIIPTNLLPETSRFWTLAESLGANVSLELVLDKSKNRTTHLVASKLGTAKVNAAKRHPDIFIVSLDWLFCCAERWEHADERLFPLKKDSAPPFLDGNIAVDVSIENSFFDPTMGKSLKGWPISKRSRNCTKRVKKSKREEEDMFSERIFVEAGLSLSQDDIDDMDKEIEEACSEESDKETPSNSSSDSSSEESLSSGDYPKGWKRPRKDIVDVEMNDAVGESSDADTIGSVDEEIAEAVKQEFGS